MKKKKAKKVPESPCVVTVTEWSPDQGRVCWAEAKKTCEIYTAGGWKIPELTDFQRARKLGIKGFRKSARYWVLYGSDALSIEPGSGNYGFSSCAHVFHRLRLVRDHLITFKSIPEDSIVSNVTLQF